MKLIHRNLFVASRDPEAASTKCRAPGCQHDESMLHLAACPTIRRHYWDKIEDLLRKLNIRTGTGFKFWITGEIDDKKYADTEAAGIIFLAWRCLYAETVRARIKDEQLRLKHAYARLLLMIISRLKAQGQKWYRWYSKTKGISEHKVKQFPKKYRKRKLMTTTADANYKLNQTLLDEYDKVKTDRQ